MILFTVYLKTPTTLREHLMATPTSLYEHFTVEWIGVASEGAVRVCLGAEVKKWTIFLQTWSFWSEHHTFKYTWDLCYAKCIYLFFYINLLLAWTQHPPTHACWFAKNKMLLYKYHHTVNHTRDLVPGEEKAGGIVVSKVHLYNPCALPLSTFSGRSQCGCVSLCVTVICYCDSRFVVVFWTARPPYSCEHGV